MLNRRHFLAATSTAFGGLALAGCTSTVAGSSTGASGILGQNIYGYGPLERDPAGLFDLPKGFRYQVISSLGETMSDGMHVPDRADGMGCFAYDANRVALVRNHELSARHVDKGAIGEVGKSLTKSYDVTDEGSALPGGTSTLLYNIKTGKLEEQWLSLVGTIRNCAGGPTPWGSWLTCEEDLTRAGKGVKQDHGWVFEVPSKHRGLVDPIPLKDMGRFNHEAASVDPRTGIVYLTEDRSEGLLYRFLPNAKGELAKGGRLQALALEDTSMQDSRNWNGSPIAVQAPLSTRWIDLDGTDAPDDDLRQRGAAKGATLFARGEGIWMGDDAVYFCCTSGGAAKLGQVMRYRPSRFEGQTGEVSEPGMLDIFVESTGKAMLDFADNVTVAPNGHLFACEDQYTTVVDNRIRGISPKGEVYGFGRLHLQTELAGACFSPDGSTLFVNVYGPTKTLAITGPWGAFKG